MLKKTNINLTSLEFILNMDEKGSSLVIDFIELQHNLQYLKLSTTLHLQLHDRIADALNLLKALKTFDISFTINDEFQHPGLNLKP